MDCKQARDIIRQERDGVAVDEDLDRLKSHLHRCKNCRSFRQAALGAAAEEEEELPRRPSRRTRAQRVQPGGNLKFVIIGVGGAALLLAAGLFFLGREEIEEEARSLVPDAASACSTAEDARVLSVVLALESLDEALSIRINTPRLIAAEFARIMALRARTEEDVGDIRLLLAAAYGTSWAGAGAGASSSEPGESVRRALLLVRARAHADAAEALGRAGVSGALLAHERLMTGSFSTSAAGIAGEAIAAHAAPPPHTEDLAKRARFLARACRFDEALEIFEGVSARRGRYSLIKGLSLKGKERRRDAMDELMKLTSSSITVRQAAGFLLAGMTLLEQGRYSEGMRTLERGTEIAVKVRGVAGAIMSYGLAWLYLRDYGSGRMGLTYADAMGGSGWLAANATPRVTAWAKELIALRRKSPERRTPPRTKFTDAMGEKPEDSDVSYVLRTFRFDSQPSGLSGGTVENRPGRGGVLSLAGARVSFDAPFVETVTTIACSVSVSAKGTLEIFAETARGERYAYLVPGLPVGEWTDLDVPLGAFEGPGLPFGKQFRRLGFFHLGGALIDDVAIFHGPQFTR